MLLIYQDFFRPEKSLFEICLTKQRVVFKVNIYTHKVVGSISFLSCIMLWPFKNILLKVTAKNESWVLFVIAFDSFFGYFDRQRTVETTSLEISVYCPILCTIFVCFNEVAIVKLDKPFITVRYNSQSTWYV